MGTGARHRAGQVAERDLSAGSPASFKLQEAKLHPPSARPGIVARPALVDRLMTGRAPLVCLIAPPGYGKTTLLAEWAGREPRPVAWVAVDRHDNDPAVLLTYLAVALHRIRPLDPAVFTALASPGTAAARSGLAAAVSAMADPVCLVLDHVELLTNQQCLDDVAELALHLPAGSQLLLASRFRPPLPLAMQGAEGRVLEIGAAELAMDGREARALLEGAGVAPTDPEVAELVGRTEGWPVGLYLAALALQAGGAQRDAGFAFTGDDRFMADYLRQELLAGSPPSWCRSSPGRRCWTACPGRRATRSWRPAGRAGSWPRWSGRTSCWWRSTGSTAGTATTTCSASCSGPSWSAASPSCPGGSTSARPAGARPTSCRSWPSTTPGPPATPTWSPAWSSG